MSERVNKSLKTRLRRWWWVAGYTVRFFGPRIARVLGNGVLLLALLLGMAQVLVSSALWVHERPPFEAGPAVMALAVVGVYAAISCTLTVLGVLLGFVFPTRRAIATVCASFLAFLLMTESFEVLGRVAVVMPALMGGSISFFLRRLRPFTRDSWNGKPLDPQRGEWGLGR